MSLPHKVQRRGPDPTIIRACESLVWQGSIYAWAKFIEERGVIGSDSEGGIGVVAGGTVTVMVVVVAVVVVRGLVCLEQHVGLLKAKRRDVPTLTFSSMTSGSLACSDKH